MSLSYQRGPSGRDAHQPIKTNKARIESTGIMDVSLMRLESCANGYS
jgi:hypothetical protein